MNGGPHFIELTEVTGDPRIVSLRCICFVLKDPDDGSAVIDFSPADTPRLKCKESYEQVRLSLLHTQPLLPR